MSAELWLDAQEAFFTFPGNEIYQESKTLARALNEQVKALANDPANRDCSGFWFMAEADRRVRKQLFQPSGTVRQPMVFGEGAVSEMPNPHWLLNAQAEIDRRMMCQLVVADKILAANCYLTKDDSDRERIYLAWRMVQREMNNEILTQHIPSLREPVRQYAEIIDNFFCERAFQS